MLPRFVLSHIGIGALLATGFMAALLQVDLHGIGTLLLLWFFLGLTFASVQLAVAIMLHVREDA